MAHVQCAPPPSGTLGGTRVVGGARLTSTALAEVSGVAVRGAARPLFTSNEATDATNAEDDVRANMMLPDGGEATSKLCYGWVLKGNG